MRLCVVFIMIGVVNLGCGEEGLKSPILADVCVGTIETSCSQQSVSGQSTLLLLLGYHFTPVWEIDLGHGDPPKPLGQFRVFMDAHEIGPATLREDTLWGYEAVEATMPESLEPGLYDVTLQTPSGKSAELSDAFTLLPP